MGISAIETTLLLGLAPTAAAAVSEGLCRVSDTLRRDADVVEGAAVTAILMDPPQATSEALLAVTERSTTTDADGEWALELTRGMRYRVRIRAAGVNHVVTIPEQATATFRDLL